MAVYASAGEKFHWLAELFGTVRISPLRTARNQGYFLKLQGLNSRGNVEQVMKDVKSQASKSAATGKQGGLNAEIQSRIGHQLRAMYDDVVRQGVPDRFAELIRKLDVPQGAPQVEEAGDQAIKNDGRD
jgi:hypothetical protein